MGMKRYRGSIISKSIALIIHAPQTSLRSILKAKSHSTNMQSMLDFIWKKAPTASDTAFSLFLLTHLSKCFNQLVLWHRTLVPLWYVSELLCANRNLMDLSGKIKIKMTMWVIRQIWEERWWTARETKICSPSPDRKTKLTNVHLIIRLCVAYALKLELLQGLWELLHGSRKIWKIRVRASQWRT